MARNAAQHEEIRQHIDHIDGLELAGDPDRQTGQTAEGQAFTVRAIRRLIEFALAIKAEKPNSDVK